MKPNQITERFSCNRSSLLAGVAFPFLGRFAEEIGKRRTHAVSPPFGSNYAGHKWDQKLCLQLTFDSLSPFCPAKSASLHAVKQNIRDRPPLQILAAANVCFLLYFFKLGFAFALLFALLCFLLCFCFCFCFNFHPLLISLIVRAENGRKALLSEPKASSTFPFLTRTPAATPERAGGKKQMVVAVSSTYWRSKEKEVKPSGPHPANEPMRTNNFHGFYGLEDTGFLPTQVMT